MFNHNKSSNTITLNNVISPYNYRPPFLTIASFKLFPTFYFYVFDTSQIYCYYFCFTQSINILKKFKNQKTKSLFAHILTISGITYPKFPSGIILLLPG